MLNPRAFVRRRRTPPSTLAESYYGGAISARPTLCRSLQLTAIWRRIAWLTMVLWLASAAGTFAAEKVSFINIDGAIGPATASYISRSIEEARAQNAQCLVIQLNTPGGLLDSTQKIVQSFLGSPVPVVVYVAPTGATATSAGCFITIAASVAAMAPATTIGAAHPVSIGGFPSGGEEKPDETMKQKLENFSISYIETIAGKRQRNIEWAKSAVKDSASITADKALQLKVIDVIASDMSDLLQKLNGRVVDGKTLKTAGAQVSEIKMSPSERVFQKLWRPEVMFILMLIAMYGIIAEVSTPGAILPGVAGAIALVLFLYMTAILPVNVTGLVLIALAIMLFNRADPLYRLSLNYIIPATLITAAFFIFIIGKGLRAQRLPVKVGAETLIGKTVTAVTPINSRTGRVFVEGEYWNAVSDTPIEKDGQAEIAAVQGLTVKLQPKGK